MISTNDLCVNSIIAKGFKFVIKVILISLLAILFHAELIASEDNTELNKPVQYKPMTLNLSDDGTQYIRFITLLQVWALYNENNLGTIGYDFKSDPNASSFAIRRARFVSFAQLSPRWLVLLHFGINNQSFSSGGLNASIDGKKPQLFFHDAFTEFNIIPQKLSLGFGLHYWNGVSRFASASVLNMMTLDAPIANWYAIETNDQFGRQIGFYAKGQLGRLDYRVAINQPFTHGVNPYLQVSKTTNTINTELAAKNALTNTFAPAAYFKFMFLDHERNLLPYEPGSYLGEKRIFNVGAGFYHHPNSTYSYNPDASSDSLRIYNTTILGADIFFDSPVGDRGFAINAYLLYQNMNYGVNYLRNFGILNPAPVMGDEAQLDDECANRSALGPGNIQPMLGTGNIVYAQAGLKFPALSNGSAFMPYVTYTNKSFEAIGPDAHQYDAGLNYFLSGHHVKVTVQYGARPIYRFDPSSPTGITPNGLKGQFTFQSHIFF